MAYFSNGSEGASFVEIYCVHCRNYIERDWRPETGEGCPIWDLHLLLDQYKACNTEPSTDPEKGGLAVTKFVLDFLIEDDERGGNRCSMFLPRGAEDDGFSLDLPFGAEEVG